MQNRRRSTTVRTLESSRSYIFLSCHQITQGREEKKKRDALIALPSEVADAHRLYNGLPVPVELVWREKFDKSALWRSSHEYCICEVVAIHAQHDLSTIKKNTSTGFSLCVRGERRQRCGKGQVQQNLRLTVD